MCETVKLPGGGVAIVCGSRGSHSQPKPAAKAAAPARVPPGWPATIAEAQAAGYHYSGSDKECSCGTRVMWFITPARKWMPVSALKDSRLVPHHAVCERVKEFRRANAKHSANAAKNLPAKAEQISMFAGEASRAENSRKEG
jgi:hypothetical protein